MITAFLIGRIVFGIYLLFNASNHFMRLEMLSGYAASKGVPTPKLAVIVTGLLLLLGGLSIATGVLPYVGAAMVVVFMVPVAFMMHNFWAVEDQQAQMVEMVNFTKNLALAAAALMFLAIPSPWPLSLGF